MKNVNDMKTVGQLIDELKNFDPNMPVGFVHHTGDYWGNIGVVDIGNVDVGETIYSGYIRMPKLIDPCEYDYDRDDKITEMVVLE